MKEWINLTSDEINELDRNIPVLVPVGLVEAHGPHLPVSVDIDSATYFSRAVAKNTGAIIVPTLPYGFSDEMREYPGSLGLSVEVFSQVIVDLAKNLCQQGFKKVIFITGHGANKAPCELAFYKVWEQYPDFKGVCWNWWSDCGISGIHHADKGETEVAVACGTAVYMDRVKDFKVEKPWYKIRSRYELDPASGGINGKPSEADFANGEKVRDQAVEVLTQKVKAAFGSI
ncbi:creatininase family protein [Persicobacter psychrovividus]|uniref:Creatinine amidohydrolase n=1 Tax=Persicobacter psychrovividus TaxID=387638 RepID=A0ABN6LDG1_9BACT|nr:creatinine amidohydrolase [Persicobacter psychrovividus]